MDEKYQRIKQYFKNKTNLNALKGDLKGSQISNNKTNSNKRDYDKEPLIIKSYERFFVGYLHYIPLLLTPITYFILYNDPLNEPYYQTSDRKNQVFILFMIVFVFILIIFGIILFYKNIIKINHQVYFKQNFIYFYENGKPKSCVDNLNIKNLIVKPIWSYYITKKNIFENIACILPFSFLFILDFTAGAITLIFLCFYILFFKVIAQIIFGKNLRDFKFFNTICVAEPIVPKGYITDGKILAQRYYLIYYFDKKTYDEIKTYFLDRKRIDIDKIRKDYFILF